jgi:hypothetical protein
MTVRNVGKTPQGIFLDSETDYRDQRNLVIAMSPRLAAELARQYGSSKRHLLEGKRITVTGVARRVRIDLIANGQPTGKFYYQTHVRVQHAFQIGLLP